MQRIEHAPAVPAKAATTTPTDGNDVRKQLIEFFSMAANSLTSGASQQPPPKKKRGIVVERPGDPSQNFRAALSSMTGAVPNGSPVNRALAEIVSMTDAQRQELRQQLEHQRF